MHELSIAVHIVESLTEEFAARQGRIAEVRLEVGVLSGVVPDALQFAWDVACENSRLAGSRLRIDVISAMAHCPQCRADQPIVSAHQLQCPVCQSWTPDIVAGNELKIRSVEFDLAA